MIQVLIVDDEEIIRRGIRNKIAKLNGNYEVIGEASDGEEALVKAMTLCPDVIITDIKMPKLDGLMLIEKIAKQLQNTLFIIVSGYQDFSYAQKALKLGVCDYLLKPIDNAEFQALLDRLMDRFQLRERHGELIRSLKNQTGDAVYQQKNHDFMNLMRDDSSAVATVGRYGFNSEEPVRVCVVKIKTAGEIFAAPNAALACVACANLFEQVLSVETECFAFHNFDITDRFYCLIFGDYEEKRIVEWTQQAISKTLAAVDTHLCAYIGKPVENILHVQLAFASASRVADQSAVYINRQLLTDADYLAIEGNEYALSPAEKKQLEAALMQGDYASAQTIVRNIFQTLAERKIVRAKIDAVLVELFGILISVLKAQKLYGTSDLVNKDIDLLIASCDLMEDIKNSLLKHALYICETVKRNETESGKNIINKIVAYIEDRYFTNIKLGDVADEYFINTSYLSQLFLQETSKNFKQFLCEVRINNAKELLENTTLPVSQIAELVGYNDRSYFSNVFTKFVGLTPAQYRKENCGGEDE